MGKKIDNNSTFGQSPPGDGCIIIGPRDHLRGVGVLNNIRVDRKPQIVNVGTPGHQNHVRKRNFARGLIESWLKHASSMMETMPASLRGDAPTDPNLNWTALNKRKNTKKSYRRR